MGLLFQQDIDQHGIFAGAIRNTIDQIALQFLEIRSDKTAIDTLGLRKVQLFGKRCIQNAQELLKRGRVFQQSESSPVVEFPDNVGTGRYHRRIRHRDAS